VRLKSTPPCHPIVRPVKFQIQLQTTRASLARAIERALVVSDESTADHRDSKATDRGKTAWIQRARWFRDDETVTVEIDADAETCVVLEKVTLICRSPDQ
jgi:hypothetical protein